MTMVMERSEQSWTIFGEEYHLDILIEGEKAKGRKITISSNYLLPPPTGNKDNN